jgi:hypothetical protein
MENFFHIAELIHLLDIRMQITEVRTAESSPIDGNANDAAHLFAHLLGHKELPK